MALTTAGSHAGKTYIITGGASGLGRAASVLLGRAGAHIVIADSNAAAGIAAAESIGSAAAFIATDLRSVDSLQALVEQTVQRFGSIDGLANIAAVHRQRTFLDTTVDDWEFIDQINHRAVFFLTQAVVRTMVEGGSPGSVVNVASGAAFRPAWGQSAYAGTKGGIVALSRNLAAELKPHGIRVNVLAPGHTASDSVLDSVSQEKMDDIAKGLLGERWMTSEEVAETLVFLLGDLSRGMTGACLTVNLGDYMPH